MERARVHLLIAVFFVSTATLCLEVTLTRYFSISQEYHFAFLVVSIAFLGYGASGSFLALFRKLSSLKLDTLLTLSSLLLSVSILASFLLSNSLSFDFIKLTWDKNQVLYIFLYYLLLSLPFFFAGLTVSSAVSRLAREVNRVYFFDLVGAGAGSLLASFVFLAKGDRGVFVLISLLALSATFLFSLRASLLLKIFVILLFAAELGLFVATPSWLGFRVSPFKALPVALKYPGAEHLITRWNAISEVDVLQSPATRYAPGLSLTYTGNLPPQLGISVDGGELTAITRFDDRGETALDFLSFLPSSFAYKISTEPSVLIIEPKGGLDVLAALTFQAGSIKVVESNPLIVKLLQGELAKFCGNIYGKEGIRLALSQSRAALKQDKEQYDLIVFALTDVFGSSGTGVYGFSENYLYTVESFVHILRRLRPGGIVSMTNYLLPPPRQEAKLLATWVEALERTGRNPSSHLAAVRTWGTISYFIKESPFMDEDIGSLKAFSAERLFDLVYYPGIKKEETNIYNQFNEPLYYNLTLELLRPETRKAFIRNYLYEVRPATDNRPFFFNFFKLGRVRETYRALGSKWLPLLQSGFLIPLLFLQALIISFFLIVLPLLLSSRGKKARRGIVPRVFLYFCLIGVSYMFVEMMWIQKFILFLGHPLYSISTIIFSLLLSSGVGSFFSRKVLGQRVRERMRWVILLCSGLIAISLFLLPKLFACTINLCLSLKIVITFFATFPIGFLMGFPFPSGIRLLESSEKGLIPWAWATNAFSSAVGSVLALMIAFWGGYNLVLALAAAGYLFVLPLLGFTGHRDEPDS